jgi:hypothetical protein
MKKTMIKVLSLMLVAVMMVCALASCGNISESYAEKINKAADNDEHYSYDQVVEDFGDNAIEIAVFGTGVVIAVKGCESVDDIEEKLDNGETVKGVVVTMVANKAVSATYKEITEDDLK